MGFGMSSYSKVPETIKFELIYLTSNSGIRFLWWVTLYAKKCWHFSRLSPRLSFVLTHNLSFGILIHTQFQLPMMSYVSQLHPPLMHCFFRKDFLSPHPKGPPPPRNSLYLLISLTEFTTALYFLFYFFFLPLKYKLDESKDPCSLYQHIISNT